MAFTNDNFVVGNSVVAVVGSHPVGNLLEGDSPVDLEVAVAPLASAVDHLAFAAASAFDIAASFGSIGNTVVGSMGDTKKTDSRQLKNTSKRKALEPKTTIVFSLQPYATGNNVNVLFTSFCPVYFRKL